MNHSVIQQMQWRPLVTTFRRGAAATMAASPASRALRAMAEVFGVPTFNEPDPKIEAIKLLNAAAEVEHALLVEYLYAAYSLDGSKPQARSWRRILVDIARQEMAHLISVQNLLLALRAPVHFGRQPLGTALPPFPFPFMLEPLSQQSVARYIATEMPLLSQITDAALRSKVQNILTQNGIAVDPEAGGAVHPVGLLYARLYSMFKKDENPSGLCADLEGIYPNQPHLRDVDIAGPAEITNAAGDDWNPTDDESLLIGPGSPRNEALKLLCSIAAQGEGVTDQLNSHFQRFVALYDQISGVTPVVFATLARPLAVNPVTQPPAGAGCAYIADPQSNLWAQLLNTRYEILLLTIAQAMSRSQTDHLRGTLIDWAINLEMTSNLKLLALKLATLPLSAGSQTNAGAPFELPASPFPDGDQDRWRRQQNLAAKSDALVQQIGPNEPLAGVTPLRDITVQDNAQRIPTINQQAH